MMFYSGAIMYWHETGAFLHQKCYFAVGFLQKQAAPNKKVHTIRFFNWSFKACNVEINQIVRLREGTFFRNGFLHNLDVISKFLTTLLILSLYVYLCVYKAIHYQNWKKNSCYILHKYRLKLNLRRLHLAVKKFQD